MIHDAVTAWALVGISRYLSIFFFLSCSTSASSQEPAPSGDGLPTVVAVPTMNAASSPVSASPSAMAPTTGSAASAPALPVTVGSGTPPATPVVAAVPTATAVEPPQLAIWPQGKRAAISLTYDDGLDGQLKYAVPALDARGLKGTFFLASFQGVEHGWSLPSTMRPLSPRHEAWRQVGVTGHELAGHTVFHPCESNNIGFRPLDYDLPRMQRELDDSLLRLELLGATAPLSFAYPCTSDVSGIGVGESFAPLVAERFVAARVSQSAIADPRTVDLQRVPQQGFASATPGQLVAVVDAALASGGWAVFAFHGIGADSECNIANFELEECALNYLSTEQASHVALLDYLAANEQVWVAPMGEIALHLQSVRSR